MDVRDLIQRFRRPIIGLLLGQGCDPGLAQELAHETFVEAYLHQKSFQGNTKRDRQVGPWLAGIARNLARDARRKAGVVAWNYSAETDLDQLPAQEPNAQTVAENQIAKVVRGLPGDWRQILVMRYGEECSLEQIASVLDISVRAVEGRLRRARQELKSRMKQIGDRPFAKPKGTRS